MFPLNVVVYELVTVSPPRAVVAPTVPSIVRLPEAPVFTDNFSGVALLAFTVEVKWMSLFAAPFVVIETIVPAPDLSNTAPFK
jgi:hypothetical protein